MSEQVQQFLQQATQALQDGNAASALELVGQAIALDPQNPDAYVLRGIALSQTGNPEGATAAFLQALALNPQSPKAHYNFATHQYQLGLRREALASAEEALRLDPAHASARGLVERIRLELGESGSMAPPPPRQEVPSNPYEANANYHRPGYDAPPDTHSIAFVERLGPTWVTIGWILAAVLLLLTIVQWAQQGPQLLEMFRAMQENDQAKLEKLSNEMGFGGMNALAILLSIVGMVLNLGGLTWNIMDIADRRGNWLWIIPYVLCCCCGLQGIALMLYITMGRKP